MPARAVCMYMSTETKVESFRIITNIFFMRQTEMRLQREGQKRLIRENKIGDKKIGK